jgi:adenosylmethionine-8-amino-7-oxononanoate aminotransferase
MAMQGDNRSNMFFWPRPELPMVDRGEGIHIWDSEGRRYIDASSGPQTTALGHGNRRVAEAVAEQMAKITYAFPSHFLNEPSERLAHELAEQAPWDLDRVFFCSGGSEAVEACIKLARQHAIAIGEGRRYKIVSRMPSYHGTTLGALSLTGDPAGFGPFAPMLVNQPKIPAPFCRYRPEGESEEVAALRFADALEREIVEQGPETVLAFIMEPIGGAATGALTAPKAYYSRVREICDAHGVLLILDEVMSGAGRAGRFLAAELWDVRPDLAALAKGLAAGYFPFGACLTSTRLLDAVEGAGGFNHGHTYSASPLACAVGRAVLAEHLERDLYANAARMGALLKARLEALAEDFAFVGEVKGEGLLLGFDVVADAKTGAPLPPELNANLAITEAARSRGLIIYSRRMFGGVRGDQFLVSPPLIVTEADIDEIAGLLGEALADFRPIVEYA